MSFNSSFLSIFVIGGLVAIGFVILSIGSVLVGDVGFVSAQQSVFAQQNEQNQATIEDQAPVGTQATTEDLTSDYSPTYFVARVSEVAKESRIIFDGQVFYTQEVLVVDEKSGEQFAIKVGGEVQPLTEAERLEVGRELIISEQEVMVGETQAVIIDVYRLPFLAWLLVGFCALIIMVSGPRGILPIIGMALSLAILLWYVVPQILAGENPVMVSMIGATFIGAITVYLSHGFGTKSHLALASIFLTLLAVSLLSFWYVSLAQLVGLGAEEAYFLQFGPTATISLQGLLLGGIMLGALGVLDDVTVSQASTVFELKRANKKLDFSELYKRGMRVGRDHVASLVNTLVLAYAGANLPLFILFVMGDGTPAWVLLSSEIIAEEVVRTLIGSMGLVAAVPLTTALTAYWVSNRYSVRDE